MAGVLSELSDGDYEKVKAGNLSVLSDDQYARYKQESGYAAKPAAAEEPKDTVLDEPHPAISTMDRALIQGAANTSEEKVAALKQRYPELHVKKEAGTDRVLVRAEGEKDYHVLSPSFSPFRHPLNTLKDLPGQVMDAAWPLASGTATAAAATGGGALGLYTGGPVGMVSTGGTAGAMAGAGMEKLRQKFGRAAGIIPQDEPEDTRKVGAAGVVGGVGGAVQEVAPMAWQGIKNRVLPWMGELTSGVPRDVIKTTAERLPEVNTLNDPDAQLALLQGTREGAQGKIHDALKFFGKGGEEAVAGAEAAGEQIPLEPARQELEAHLAKLQANLAKQPENETTQEAIRETQGVLQRFGFNGNPAGKEAEDAFKAGLDDELQKKTAAVAQYFGRAPTEQELLETGGEYAAKNKGLLNQAATAGPRSAVNPANARNMEQGLHKLANAEHGYGAKPGDVLNDLGLRNATRRAADRIAEGLGEATGGKFTTAQKGYSRTMADSDVLQQLFGKNFEGSDTLLAGKLANLPNPAKAPDLSWMRGMDRVYDTGIEDTANLMRANKFMGKPSLLPISAGGTTSTSRSLGIDAGAKAGEALLSAAAPESAGYIAKAVNVLRGVISPLAGPAAIKQYIRMHHAVFDSAFVQAVESNPNVVLTISQLLKAGAQTAITPNQTKARPVAPPEAPAPDVPVVSPWNRLQNFIGGQK